MIIWIKRCFYLIFGIFILYNIFISSTLVRLNEVSITNDIGRDFLLLQELDQKKIVLIGARSNVQGVFHGPLWTYMNYPAYLLGGGNPVTIAWFWILFSIISLVTTFILMKKMFGNIPAVLAVTMLSVYLVPFLNSMFGPEAMFYFMPVFLFSMYKYLQTKKGFFLATHFVFVGFLIHLNIGAGILISMLSIMLSLIIIVKNRTWSNIVSLLTLPLICINFIIFDLRHNFLITRALLHLGGSSKFLIPFNEWILQRINITISMQILINNIPTLTTLIFLAVVVFTIIEINKNYKHKYFLLLLAFYYFGYIFLSYFNKGTLLIDQIFLLIPITLIWLAVLTGGKYKIIFIPIVILVIYLNFNSSNAYINYAIRSIGKAPDSWTSMKNVADLIIKEEKGKEFGYFVYSPDSFAYQQRYAMSYSFKSTNIKAFEYRKLPITFVIVSPRPIDKPFMGEQWWIQNEAKIIKTPMEIIDFPSGYKIEKFELNEQERKINYDPNIKLELNFR